MKAVLMKIIHLTDLHLGAASDVRYGADQHQRLAACVRHINARHADAAVCIVTGDLADRGDETAYRDLAAALQALAVPYRLLPGNHDERDGLRAAFPALEPIAGGYLQSVFDGDTARLILLDTLASGRVEGQLDDTRLAWLRARLSEATAQNVLIFMHHPPLAIGIPMLDPLALADPAPFLDTVLASGIVAHLFFGHVHRAVHGAVRGIPFSAQRGLSVQFDLDLDAVSNVGINAPPSYGVILVSGAGVVVHAESFADGFDRYDLATGAALN